jgi:NTP pyrophosphatase (non-canonical NTP hydrolase)
VVDWDELCALRAELSRLRAREQELLEKNSALVFERQGLLTIGRMSREAHATARSKGWWSDDDLDTLHTNTRLVPTLLSLIHSEVSEALEVFRRLAAPRLIGQPCRDMDGKPVGFDSELADVVIRVGDLAGAFGIDLERAVREKMAFNLTRPMRHGGKRC